MIKGSMYLIRCSSCQTEIPDDSKFCQQCGKNVTQEYKPAKIAQLLGFTGLATTCLCIGILFDIAAVILGIWSSKQIKKSHGQYTGEVKAKNAILLGGIMIPITVLYMLLAIPNFIAFQIHDRVTATHWNLKDVSKALETC